ncbi:MAG: ABC transporter substrate-binding protein [Actinobacteria bacterium]|nr:ABC transporter substrate-binding protein [Actinomycetota bacterium]
MTTHRPRPTAALAAALTGLAMLLTGCSGASGGKIEQVNIGYFPNLTHAPGLIADAEGTFVEKFGTLNLKVSTKSFNAGPDVIQAILSGSLDISYIGPNPTVTAYIQSQGDGIRVIAGSTSGGAFLVVKPEITSAAQLKGRKLATPQLGNTQDIALRYWLKQQNLTATEDGGGDVSILPQANSAAVQAFSTGSIDGAWVPEPYASKLVAAGGKVLVDEKSLWPDGQFVTTNVIARTAFVEQHPDAVRAFIEAHLDALAEIKDDPEKAQADVAGQIQKITGQETTADSLKASWKNLDFTADPLASTLKESADHAAAVGLLPNKPTDGFAKLWDLTALNDALTARGQQKVGS